MAKMPEANLPDVNDPATAPFWAGAKDGKLVMQTCDKCGYVRWPPGPLCTECLSEDFTWKEIAPTGTLWSYAVYHRAMNPRFKDDIPYTVVLVELDDGPRMYGRLVPNTADIEPGTRMRAVFQDIGPDVKFVTWEIDKA
jgi:hypothetical protein